MEVLKRAIALAVVALSLAHAPLASGIGPLTADCLKGWGIDWKLPYFPQLIGDCPADEIAGAGGPGWAGLRRKRLVLGDETEWMPVKGERLLFPTQTAAAQASFAHFNLLFLQQGLKRRANADAERDNANGPGFPSSAVYEKDTGKALLRITWSSFGGQTTLLLEESPKSGTAPRLPTPDRPIPLYENGQYGAWFTLPGTTLVEEKIGGNSSQLQIPRPQYDPKTYITPEWGVLDEGNRLLLFPPTKTLVYRFPPGLTKAQVGQVYRSALAESGWKIDQPTGVMEVFTGFFDLPDRRLRLYVTLYAESPAMARVDVTDVVFYSREAVVAESLYHQRHYTFTPTFTAEENPTADTKIQIDAIVHYMRTQSARDAKVNDSRGIALSPAVSADLVQDAAARKEGLAHARWLAKELQRRGWKDSELRVLEDTVTPKRTVPEFRSGVRAAYYHCVTSVEARPQEKVSTCVCRIDTRIFATTAGACR